MWVIAVVGVPPMVSVVAAPKAETVVESVLNTSMLVSPSTDTLKVGLVANTGAPVPVAVSSVLRFRTRNSLGVICESLAIV